MTKQTIEALGHIGRMTDLIMDISMKLAGMYLFFIKLQFLDGALIMGMSGIYSISMVIGKFLIKEGKVKVGTDG